MISPPSPLLDDALLTVHDLARTLKVCKRTVWRWLALGRLPQPIRYSRTCVRWTASAIRAYLDSLQPGPVKGNGSR